MDPTTACNLKCIGCWAADYGHKMRMSYQALDSIVEQGKAMGTYVYLFSGGEPLIRKKDIIRLCETHSDCMFLAFTNGTFIDEAFADEVKRIGNFLPAISIEGPEALTDARRGAGTYQAVVRAMGLLRERHLAFGFSTCYTSANVEAVGGDQYIDEMMALGCKFGWYFTYMPVGNDSPTDLMATDEQRAFMYRQVRHFREEKPIFLMDFWNDGEYVDGCVAGGRRYLHINANGDVEPCAFIHYSTANINDVSLLEALKSPLFAEYRKGQPFNANMLRPCPLLDNPDALAGMVHRSGAHSTDMSSPEDVDALTDKCRPAAERWAATSADLWLSSPAGQRCLACRQDGALAAGRQAESGRV
jgi:MoaA/NifB/PqqE/SkfB family radical SAM enzyme